MDNRNELKNQIQFLISENQTKEALEILAKEQLSSLDKELIMLNSRFNKIEEDRILGIIDDNEARQELNKINLAILGLSEKIGTPESGTGNGGAKTQGHGGSGAASKFLLRSAIAVLLILAAILFYNLKTSNAFKQDNSTDDTTYNNPEIESETELEPEKIAKPAYLQFNRESSACKIISAHGKGYCARDVSFHSSKHYPGRDINVEAPAPDRVLMFAPANTAAAGNFRMIFVDDNRFTLYLGKPNSYVVERNGGFVATGYPDISQAAKFRMFIDEEGYYRLSLENVESPEKFVYADAGYRLAYGTPPNKELAQFIIDWTDD